MAIDQIKLAKCDVKLVAAELKRLSLPPGGSLREQVERLASYYDERSGSMDIADCDVCGSPSDAKLDSCPFCGTSGVVETGGDLSAEAEDDEADPGVEAEGDDDGKVEPENNDDDEGAEPGEGEGEVAASKKKGGKKAAKVKTVTAPKGKAKPVAKEARKGKAKAAEAENDDVHPVEIVPSGVAGSLSTLHDLEEHITTIRTCFVEGGSLAHKMGVAANRINDDGLWKLRVGPDNVPLYRTFKEFCVKEIAQTPQAVYRSMAVAKNFSEAEVRELSHSQLRVVLQLPAGGGREELLAQARGGTSTGRLTERANQLRGKQPQLGAAKPDIKTEDAKKALTVALVMGHHKIKMYKTPTTGSAKVGETKDAVRAKKMADKPWGVVELSNKVRMIIRTVANPQTGELVADVEFRRGTPTE